jgi:hypothetical protein
VEMVFEYLRASQMSRVFFSVSVALRVVMVVDLVENVGCCDARVR